MQISADLMHILAGLGCGVKGIKEITQADEGGVGIKRPQFCNIFLFFSSLKYNIAKTQYKRLQNMLRLNSARVYQWTKTQIKNSFCFWMEFFLLFFEQYCVVIYL